PGSVDSRFADRHRLVRQLLRLQMVIEILVLAENHRVIYGDRLEQHAVSVLNSGRCHHYQTRIMRIDGLHALTMEWAASGSASARQPNRDRTRHLGPPVERGGLIDDLIESDCGKIRKLHLDNWAHSLD